MREYIVRAALPVDLSQLADKEIDIKGFRHYFPAYICQDEKWDIRFLTYYWLKITQFFIQSGIKLVLRPRQGDVGSLSQSEVDEVYSQEAATYDLKHHLTTHGMDTTWRRWVSWCATTLGGQVRPLKVLDLCTGTGLTPVEMAPLFAAWGIEAEIIGLDYNRGMLNQACKRKFDQAPVSLAFIRGDATRLNEDKLPREGALSGFQPNTFDAITQMFGIGGISSPLAVFESVLSVLKPGGMYFLTDMHQPIRFQPGEWTFFLKWFRFPLFEAMTYNETTIPLALSRLWAWRDPTLDFYLLPLVTSMENDNYWGYEVISREVESQRWWLNLPVMPVARMVVKKVEISAEEAAKRGKILVFALSIAEA